MKKFFKILIPILLAAAIILGLAWYLFTYDRDFTRDMLLYGARFCDRQGHASLSSWFYDRAYDMAKDNDLVAVELAQQHKDSGNYTQAENTLSKAIEDGGGIDLYVALCKTYMEQDKILDAVKLLNGITNPEVLAKLAEIRPAAPTASPDPGLYNQYISVEISGDGGTLYVSPMAEYPSVHDDPYQEPVVLQDGDNTIYAVTVAENGLVSPLSIFSYTVGGIIEEVSFADPAVEAAVRSALSLDADETVMSNQLWDILSFEVPEGTQSLEDLKYMLFLEELTMDKIPAGQLSVLSGMSHLKSLSITGTTVSSEEIEVIASLTTLERLTLSGCGLSTTTYLDTLTGLTYLDLSNNSIRNIRALESMPNLLEVNLQQNALTDLAELASLSQLKILNISHNSITTLSPIWGNSSLLRLDASTNFLTDLTGISALTNLNFLSVASNSISDFSPVAACTNLTELDISTNFATDISSLSGLNRLVMLDFSHNQVSVIPEFADDCALVTIDGAHNLISSLEPLKGIVALNNVYMDYNTEISSLECLSDNYNLVQVNVYNTKVNELSQVTCLTEHSIIVNFTPMQEGQD